MKCWSPQSGGFIFELKIQCFRFNIVFMKDLISFSNTVSCYTFEDPLSTIRQFCGIQTWIMTSLKLMFLAASIVKPVSNFPCIFCTTSLRFTPFYVYYSCDVRRCIVDFWPTSNWCWHLGDVVSLVFHIKETIIILYTIIQEKRCTRVAFNLRWVQFFIGYFFINIFFLLFYPSRTPSPPTNY